MGALQNYPYADVHQLNLDWIIKKIREIRDKEDELDQAVSDAQGYAESAQTSAESAEINALKLESIVVTNYDEYTEAINDGEDSSYICREITISSPIALSSISQCANKSFSNGLFILNSDMFTWTSALPYANIPSFVNCTFIGNGYSLVDDNLYSLNGKFVNCNFIDCSFMRNGTFCQSARFVNCNIANLSGHTFIEAKRIYDNRFIGCQLESANGATLLEATSTVPDQITVSQVSFLNCVMESQSSPIVIMRDGDITIENCYFEANSANILQVLSSNRATLPFLMIAISKTRMETTSGVTMINVDASYETSKWGALVSDFCTINTGIFTNRRLHNF